MKKLDAYRNLPKVDALLSDREIAAQNSMEPRVKTAVIRQVLDRARGQIKKSNGSGPIDIKKEVLDYFKTVENRSLQRVINATGVVLHTNLGRAPIGKESLQRLAEELSGYCSLEFDLEKASRGSRTSKIEKLICLLTGCESALFVNNNAAAVYLVLQALFHGKEVLLSRSEIVQIGGGFRVNEILEQSGAKLVEVGTTNITTLKDYEKNLRPTTGCILKVHQSNFSIKGHVESVSDKALKALCQKKKIPFVIDLGSGGLVDRGNKDGPNISFVLDSNADLVCFSGDKLLGASQAGIVAGGKHLISKIKEHPLYRALRISKLDLFLLEDTLMQHLFSKKTLTDELIHLSYEHIKSRAENVAAQIRALEPKIVKGTSSIGGGVAPEEKLPTALIEMTVGDSQAAAKKLCALHPPIVVQKRKHKIAIDLRTVFIEEEDALVRGLQCLL